MTMSKIRQHCIVYRQHTDHGRSVIIVAEVAMKEEKEKPIPGPDKVGLDLFFVFRFYVPDRAAALLRM
jgi:hypothetical protein